MALGGTVGVVLAIVLAGSSVNAGVSKMDPAGVFKPGVTLTSAVVDISNNAMTACALKKKVDDENCKKMMAEGGICVEGCFACCGKGLKVTNSTTFTIPKGKMFHVSRKLKKGKEWKGWASRTATNGLAKGKSITLFGACENGKDQCIEPTKYDYKVETGNPPEPPK
jgi:hypothetical protein